MKKLGELKENDVFYIINWDAGYVMSIEKCVVKDTVDIKIGRIIHYIKDKDEYKDVYGITIELSEYKETYVDVYYQSQACSDKDVLLEILETSKEKFLYNYRKILKNI